MLSAVPAWTRNFIRHQLPDPRGVSTRTIWYFAVVALQTRSRAVRHDRCFADYNPGVPWRTHRHVLRCYLDLSKTRVGLLAASQGTTFILYVRSSNGTTCVIQALKIILGIETTTRKLNIAQLVVAAPGVLIGIVAVAWVAGQAGT